MMDRDDPVDDDPAPVTEPRQSHSADGVDLTLIRWMLSLTPAERLRVVEANGRALSTLRRGRGDV